MRASWLAAEAKATGMTEGFRRWCGESKSRQSSPFRCTLVTLAYPCREKCPGSSKRAQRPFTTDLGSPNATQIARVYLLNEGTTQAAGLRSERWLPRWVKQNFAEV